MAEFGALYILYSSIPVPLSNRQIASEELKLFFVVFTEKLPLWLRKFPLIVAEPLLPIPTENLKAPVEVFSNRFEKEAFVNSSDPLSE